MTVTSTLTPHRPPLDIDEAAEYPGISPRFVRRLVSERRITFFKVGRFVRFSPDVLDQLLEDSGVPGVEVGR
jgi:excisionase family DNA binding protein